MDLKLKLFDQKERDFLNDIQERKDEITRL